MLFQIYLVRHLRALSERSSGLGWLNMFLLNITRAACFC